MFTVIIGLEEIHREVEAINTISKNSKVEMVHCIAFGNGDHHL